MESLIPFIIMLVIGALFNSGKKKAPEEQKRQQSKPFTSGKPEQDNPIKKLKEMSRDLYKEIQQEFEQEQEKPQQRPVEIPKQRVQQQVDVTKVEAPKREERVYTRSTEPSERQQEAVRRQARQAEKRQNKQSAVASNQLVPTTSDEIMKGIIFSEIIGPPKSKR